MNEPTGTDHLRSFVKRIEDVNEDIADRKIDLKAIYDEAKSVGFDVKTLKKVMERRKKGEKAIREELELVELYEAAISGQMTLPLGDAAKAKTTSVKLTGPDGEVLFEGTDQEFSEAAARAGRKSRAAA